MFCRKQRQKSSSAIKVYLTIHDIGRYLCIPHISGSVTKNSICDPVLGSAIKDKEILFMRIFCAQNSLISALQIERTEGDIE